MVDEIHVDNLKTRIVKLLNKNKRFKIRIDTLLVEINFLREKRVMYFLGSTFWCIFGIAVGFAFGLMSRDLFGL